MQKTLKISISQFSTIKSISPVVDSDNKELKKELKYSLLESVQEGFSDKWYNVKEGTKEALKYACMLSVERGFFFCSPTHLSKKFKISTTTVYAVLRELLEANVLYKVNRSATKHNGKGNAVYFFTKHPKFKAICDYLGVDWKANCNADCKAEIAENPTLPTSESVSQAPTLSLTSNLQKPNNNVIHSNVVDSEINKLVDNRLKEMPYKPTAPKFIKYVPKEINEKFGYFGDMLVDIWRKVKLAERKVNHPLMTNEVKMELACEIIQNLRANRRFKVMNIDEMCAYVYKAHLNAMFNYLAELNVVEAMSINEDNNYYAYLITVNGNIEHVMTNSSNKTRYEDDRTTFEWWFEELLGERPVEEPSYLSYY